LSQETVEIGQEPRLGDFPAVDAEKVEPYPPHTVAGWRDGFEFTSVRALSRVPDTDLPAFGDDFVNCYV
jgi:hypothetical protein